MRRRLVQSSSRSPLPWRGQRGIAALLLIGCLPSLLFNVGAGWSVLIHDHGGDSLHTHVVAAADRYDLPHWHAGHEHGDADDAGRVELIAHSAEGHTDAILHGTEVATSKRHAAPSAEAPVDLLLVPPVPLFHAPPDWSSSRPAAFEPAGGPPQTALSRLRAVILLI